MSLDASVELAVVFPSTVVFRLNGPKPALLIILTAGAVGGGVLPVVGGLDIEVNGGGLAWSLADMMQRGHRTYSLQKGVR